MRVPGTTHDMFVQPTRRIGNCPLPFPSSKAQLAHRPPMPLQNQVLYLQPRTRFELAWPSTETETARDAIEFR